MSPRLYERHENICDACNKVFYSKQINTRFCKDPLCKAARGKKRDTERKQQRKLKGNDQS